MTTAMMRAWGVDVLDHDTTERGFDLAEKRLSPPPGSYTVAPGAPAPSSSWAAGGTGGARVGAGGEERDDGLTITPRPLMGCAVDTYNDHRMAMSQALVGLRIPGVVIRNPGCVAKTYPGFWQDLEGLRS